MLLIAPLLLDCSQDSLAAVLVLDEHFLHDLQKALQLREAQFMQIESEVQLRLQVPGQLTQGNALFVICQEFYDYRPDRLHLLLDVTVLDAGLLSLLYWGRKHSALFLEVVVLDQESLEVDNDLPSDGLPDHLVQLA